MTVIAIVNRKGGSGKSTLATHVAAWLSRRGERAMLGDVDRQQSSVHWLRRREAQPLPGEPLVGWALDPRNVLRPPAGVAHVVLDTPGGLHGFEMSRLLVHADIVLMPVCDSVFDREAAAACLAELRAHPRVAGGRVQLGVVGMRVDARTRGEPALREWAAALEVPFLGALRDARAYVRCAEAGLTVFDLPRAKVQPDLAQWQPVLDWLDEALGAAAVRSPRGLDSRPGALAPLGAAEGRPAGAPPAPVFRPSRPIVESTGAGRVASTGAVATAAAALKGVSDASDIATAAPRAARGPAPRAANSARGLRRLFGWLLPQPVPASAGH